MQRLQPIFQQKPQTRTETAEVMMLDDLPREPPDEYERVKGLFATVFRTFHQSLSRLQTSHAMQGREQKEGRRRRLALSCSTSSLMLRIKPKAYLTSKRSPRMGTNEACYLIEIPCTADEHYGVMICIRHDEKFLLLSACALEKLLSLL